MQPNHNQSIYSSNHISFFDKVILKKRIEMSTVIKNYFRNTKMLDILDIGTTKDLENPSSNILIKNLTDFDIYKSISDQKIDIGFFKKCLQKSITKDFTNEEISEYASDLVISNATIEHVGSFKNQVKMIKNIVKLSKKFFVVITPNRFHPFDSHTKLPLLSWLPKKIHRLVLSKIGMTELSKEENLNLLSLKEIHLIMSDISNISYEIKHINFLFFKSNFIIIGKK